MGISHPERKLLALENILMSFGQVLRDCQHQNGSMLFRQGTTYRPLWDIPDLLPHEFLQFVRTLRVRRILVVVFPTVVENQHGILDEILRRRVHVFLMFLFHGRKIHRLLNDLIVVRDFISVHRLSKWPCS